MKRKLFIAGLSLALVGALVAGGWRLGARRRDEAEIREATRPTVAHLTLAGADGPVLERTMVLASLAGKGYRLSGDEWTELATITKTSARTPGGSTAALTALEALAQDIKQGPDPTRAREGFELAAALLDDPTWGHTEGVDTNLLWLALCTKDPRASAYFERYRKDPRRNVRLIVLKYDKRKKL